MKRTPLFVVKRTGQRPMLPLFRTRKSKCDDALIRDDAPIEHVNHAIGAGRHAGVMRDDDERHAQLLP